MIVELDIPLAEKDKEDLCLAWGRSAPWPDVLPGLREARRFARIAPLSNANVSLLTMMAKAGALPWDVVLSAEQIGRAHV